MDSVKVILVCVIAVSIDANIYLYSYWSDNEYPHGTKSIWAEKVTIWENGFDYTNFITIGKNCYEIKGFDPYDKLLDELDYWNAEYNISFVDDMYFPETNIVMVDGWEYGFEITFHTYDAMQNGNEITYYKQKVIDDINIGGRFS